MPNWTVVELPILKNDYHSGELPYAMLLHNKLL